MFGRASLYTADLHYGGGLVLHTASSGAVSHLSELYLRLEHEDVSGVGAVRTNITYLNGLESQAVLDEAIVALAAIDWSRSPAELLADAPLWGRHSAPVRSLIDIALHDVVAKQKKQCLAAVLGGAIETTVSFKTNQTLFWSSHDDFVTNAARYVERGFRELKVRIGIAAFDEDCRRIATLREQFGETVDIAADANGRWPVETALERLNILSAFRLTYVEQPVAAGAWGCLAKLAEDSPIPIMLDESIAGEADLERVCQFGEPRVCSSEACETRRNFPHDGRCAPAFGRWVKHS